MTWHKVFIDKNVGITGLCLVNGVVCVWKGDLWFQNEGSLLFTFLCNRVWNVGEREVEWNCTLNHFQTEGLLAIALICLSLLVLINVSLKFVDWLMKTLNKINRWSMKYKTYLRRNSTNIAMKEIKCSCEDIKDVN